MTLSPKMMLALIVAAILAVIERALPLLARNSSGAEGPTRRGPFSVLESDLNRDGLLDVVTTATSQTASRYRWATGRGFPDISPAGDAQGED